MKAANRARSVCRVEVGDGNKGTGVLIHPDLVLTNYHVMGKTLDAAPDVLLANAANTILRFGAFTAEGPAAAGQEVPLHKDKPIVASSPGYDFALLRTADSIAAAADVMPFSTLGVLPVKTNPLYVLQHPEGGPMKLALNTSGVSWIDPGLVTIQYTTKVARGSSGSPCFDTAWNLVALHHAGAGSKGEGILMKSIFGQIQQYLDA
jgi:V8-like Glu-specific endopeptidase